MAKFTTGELRVMRILWEHGELKPAQLQELHPEPIKNPALRSYLAVLLEKGHVTRRKVGKAYFYRARTPRQRAFSAMLGDLVDTFCAGSVEELLMALVRKEKLSDEDLLELKRLADAPTAEGAQPSGSSKPKRNKGKTR